MIKKSTLAGLLTFALVLSLMATFAFADKIEVKINVQDGRVFIESTYADKTPIESANVVVYNTERKKLFLTTTDKMGKLDFAVPANVEGLRIIVDAPKANRAEFNLTKEDLGL